MAEWVSHLIVADRALEKLPQLSRHEFCVGNIAPDCNIPNEDWTEFTPSRAVTHWMQDNGKKATDCVRFYDEYIIARLDAMKTKEEFLFLLGYYAHLITDAELQRTIRDDVLLTDIGRGKISFCRLLRKEYKGFLERAVNNVTNAIEAFVLQQM